MALAGPRVCPRNEVAHLALPGVFNGSRPLTPALLQELVRQLGPQPAIA